jgi:hypothetical protein
MANENKAYIGSAIRVAGNDDYQILIDFAGK